MPLFFLLSGYLNFGKKKTNYKEFIKRKFNALIVPFLIFRILLLLYWFFIESYFRELDLGPIWFLPVLFFVDCTSWFMSSKSVRLNACFLGVYVLLFLFLKTLTYSNALHWILLYINGTIWFIWGLIIGILKDRVKISSSVYSIILISVLSILSIGGGHYNGVVSMWSYTTNNYLLYTILGLCGSFMIFLFCKYLIIKNSLIEYIGLNTILILAMHEPIKRILLKLICILMSPSSGEAYKYYLQNNLLTGFLISVAVLLLTLPFITILQKTKEATGKWGNLLLNFIH